jgi:peptidyl-prolyl cis-trans isomerase D
VHVRDIKISFAGITSQDVANVKFHLVDSIYKEIDSLKGNFMAFAFAYSDDQASKMKGGDLGWVKQGEKDKAINDLIFFHAEKGKLYKIPVQSENAIHLLQVVEDKPSKPAVEVAYFSKEIVPSPETERTIYGTATAFAADNQGAAKFKAAGEKLHIKTVSALKKDAFDVEGLQGSARELVKWAFNAKKGDVSPVFTVEKKHVVALVEDVRSKGLPDLESLRAGITPEVKKDKEFELLSKKITDANAANIDALGTKLGKPVTLAEKSSFARPVVSSSYEPKVVAAALVTPVGKLSAPIKGNNGVFVTQTVSIQEPLKTTDYNMYTYQMKMQLQSKSKYSQDVEKKLAKIDDNRFDFF